MAWITSAQVSVVLQTDLSADTWIDDLIDHVQGLAEVEIGTQTEPVGLGLQSVFAQIVARMWRAGKAAASNPSGYQSEQIDDYRYATPVGGAPIVAGLALTKTERAALKKAVGQSQFWVQPTMQNAGLETAGPGTRGQHPNPPPAALVDDAAGGDQINWFHTDDLEVTG
jgi:hypothetical protein